MQSLRYCRIILNFAPAEVPMSYLCEEDFKPYILFGHSPPILATSLTRQSLRLCRSIFQIQDSLTAGHRSGPSRSITATGSVISGRSPSVSFHKRRVRLPLLKSIDARLPLGRHLSTMFSSDGMNTPKPFRPIDRHLTELHILPGTIFSFLPTTDSHKLVTSIFRSLKNGGRSLLCILSSCQQLRLMTAAHFESTSM